MSAKSTFCPSAIKHMQYINSTLKPYGTRYLISDNNSDDCIFRFFCEEANCVTNRGNRFEQIKSPYEHYALKGECSEDISQILSDAKKISDYYGITKNIQKLPPIYGKSDDITMLLMKHMWDENRTVFSREFDRIIYTNVFRRLQYKTQVMVNSASDDQRTRLLHSLEVQKVAKKIAVGVGANWELAETIAIAHDIGHTPFGHEGEYAIKSYLQKNGCGAFSHALQSVKVLDEITTHPVFNGYGLDGLCLSNYVLEGVLKHDSDTFTDGMKQKDFKLQFDVEHLCGIVGCKYDDKTCRKEIEDALKTTENIIPENCMPQVLIGSVESQIVAWADKIAYLGHDWEEFVDNQLLEKMMSRINDMIMKMEEYVNLSCNITGKRPTHNSILEKSDPELFGISKIWGYISDINKLYHPFNNDNAHECEIIWGSVLDKIKNIILEIDNIEKSCIDISDEINSLNEFHCHKYFTSKEYNALKNYLIMTASWAQLLEIYPRTYGLKNDPIYIFYMYLTNIRSNNITPLVINKLITKSKEYIEHIDPNNRKTRDDYLLECNKLWARKYSFVNSHKFDSKNARKYLKKSVRTCFLIGFHDDVEKDPNYIVGYTDYEKLKYDFSINYNCFLNIIDCITDEFIKSTRVKFMKHTAHEIIDTLLHYYNNHPDMLPFIYRNRYNKIQYELAIEDNVPEVESLEYVKHYNMQKARIVADYVAGMTDRMAKLKYDEIKSSDTKWSNEYTNIMK